MLVSVRVASLVPSATEMLFALGLGDSVVAVTHECDYPPGVEQLPHLTRSVIGEGLPAAEIDAAVRERTGRGESLYELDEDTLASLDVDLIVTQAVCEVCAVSFDDVRSVAAGLPTEPEVISLDPSTFGEVMGDIPRLAEAAGVPEAGEQLAEECAERVEEVELAIAGDPRPRVAALEWLDPVYVGGHWVPQMIELAGGDDVLGLPGEKSRTAEWAEVEAARPGDRGLDALRLLRRAGRGRDHAPARAAHGTGRPRGGGRRGGLLLAPRTPAGGRSGAARPHPPSRRVRGAPHPPLDRARPRTAGRSRPVL